MRTKQTNFRLSEIALAELDEIAEYLRWKTKFEHIPRADAVRWAIHRAATELRKDITSRPEK